MLDLIPSAGAWAQRLAGRQFAVATIVAASGSVPRPVGTSMLVAETGEVLGSLSGGCVEGAVVALAQEAMDDGGTRRKSFGFSSADAFAAGLTCGGQLDIHIEPVHADVPGRPAHSLRTGLTPDEPVALVRTLGTPVPAAVVLSDPANAAAEAAELESFLSGEPLRQVQALVRRGGAGLVGLGTCPPDQADAGLEAGPAVLVESRLAPPRMLREVARLPRDARRCPPGFREPAAVRRRGPGGPGLAAPLPRRGGRRRAPGQPHRRGRPHP